jgi:YHS domain-containing protein
MESMADVQIAARIDPVCQMAVDPKHACGRLIYDKTAYLVCMLTCAGHFARRQKRSCPIGGQRYKA